jgi:hypothetical protein
MSTLVTETEAEIWSRTIQPHDGNLPPEAARAWLALKLSPGDRERVNELSAKAREGTLTAREERELDIYLNVGRAMELLKAKARCSLKAAPGLEDGR